MINNLDVRTIFIGYTISNAICAIVVGFLWRQNHRRYPGLGFWLAGFTMQFAAVLLITLRGVIPDFMSIVAANTIAVAGIILLYIGLEYFTETPGPQHHNYLLLAVFFSVHTYFTYLQPSLTWRNYNFSFTTLLLCIQVAWLMFHRADVKFRPGTTSVGFIFIAIALVNICRILFNTNGANANDLFQSGTFYALATLIYQMLYMGLTFTLFLLVNYHLVDRLEVDIRERQLTEQALRVSEEKFSVAFQNIPDAVLITSLGDGKIFEANDAFFQLSNYSKEDITGQSIDDLVFWGNKNDQLEFAKVLEKEGRIQNLETSFRKMNGEVFIGWISGEIIQLQDEKCILSLIHDVTQRKKTEQALTENYSTLHNILESTDALIFSLNRQYRYTSFNSVHAKKMKELYDRDIQVGGNILEYMTVESDRLIARQNIDRSLAGEHLVEEAYSGDEDLSRRYFEVSHAPITTDLGEVIGVSIFSQDITERKEMEISLQLRLMELETVSNLSASMRAGKNLKELLLILLYETLKVVKSFDGCILLLDPVDHLLRLTESQGWFETIKDLSLRADEGIAGQLFATNEPYISLDHKTDELIRVQDRPLFPPRSSGAFLPIRGESGSIGLLIISFQLPRIASRNEVRMLTIISQLAASAITRSRLNDQVQAFNKELQNEINKKIVVQELLAAEKELLSTTLMSIAEGVIVMDKDGLVILFNRAAESITGYTLSEAIKQPINSVFRLHISNKFEIVPDVIKYLLELEYAQKNHLPYRSPLIVSKSGENILLSGNITSLKAADLEEGPAGFVLVFQNINEKLKAEAQNALSQKMEAIGQLAAGIAHEINTPIQYVGDNIKFLGKAYSKYSETLAAYRQVIHEHLGKAVTQDELDQVNELALQKKVPYYENEIPKAIQESLDGTERVRKIVLAMREFSHPSEKEKKLSDINHGIETTIVISRNEWKYCADLEADLDNELPLVYCQIDEINQVVLNMIVNASQAIQEKCPPGSEQKGNILIRTRHQEDRVFITIQDTGSGIPVDIRARIFDPFFTTKGIGKGTGQGLSMAHNIVVNKHHGNIGIDSDVGQGTTFTIELPVNYSPVDQ